jgi:hypothetical protein
MWLDISTKMRKQIQQILSPILELIKEEKTTFLGLEYKLNSLQCTSNIMEQAIFNKQNEGGRTIFDDFDDQITELKQMIAEKTKQH